MNDYWNDPPNDDTNIPDCKNDKEKCDGQGEYLYDGKNGMVFSCGKCAYQWVEPFQTDQEPEQIPEVDYSEFEEFVRKQCPHGKTEGCDACDFLGDIAYDSERERRHFGK